MRLSPQFAAFQAQRLEQRYAPAWRRLLGP
jgi:hypothetical protein